MGAIGGLRRNFAFACPVHLLSFPLRRVPSPRVIDPGEPVPKGGGSYRVGSPYFVGGRMYVPQYDPHYQPSVLPRGTARISTAAIPPTAKSLTSTHLGGARPCHCQAMRGSPISLTAIRSLCASTIAGPMRITELSTYRCGRPNCWIFTAAARPRSVSNMSALRRCRVRRPGAGSDLARERAGAGAKHGSHRPGSRVSADAATTFVPPGYRQRSLGFSAVAALRSRRAALYRGRDLDSMSYANRPNMDGTSQYLNGRGLY